MPFNLNHNISFYDAKKLKLLYIKSAGTCIQGILICVAIIHIENLFFIDEKIRIISLIKIIISKIIMMILSKLIRYGNRSGKNFINEKRNIDDTFYANENSYFSIENRYVLKINEKVPRDAVDLDLSNINLKQFQDSQNFSKIPSLAHGLNKLLDGRIHMGDQGFGKFEGIQKDILNELSNYTPPTKDKTLFDISKRSKCKYYSSTSNISIPFIHLYFVFSMFRRPNFDNIFVGQDFNKNQHMNHFKKPCTFYLTKMNQNNQALYAIDADQGFSYEKQNQVLTNFGIEAEFRLTHSSTRSKQRLQTRDVKQKPQNYYRYSMVNDNILLRSQIDCRDIDKNGNPFVFELKTRACAPIRYDVQNTHLYKDYPINKMKGDIQSFQKQYHDLIRGAFLKYAFQLKIGRMDGAFIMYHNTESIYGFEYIHFRQIIMRLFGDQYNLDVSFVIIGKMLTSILDYILDDTKQYKYDDLKIGFHANSLTKSLIVIVEVMSEVKKHIKLKRQNVLEYFEKQVKVLKNPVIKYEFSFFTILNNILVRHPEIYYTPYDNINIKWKIKKYGRILKQQYIEFLQEAYKEDSVYSHQKYGSKWIPMNDIKP